MLAAVSDAPTAPGVARWAGETARAAGTGVVLFTAVQVLPEVRVAGLGWITKAGTVSGRGEVTAARVVPVLEGLGVAYRVEIRSYQGWGGERARARRIARAIRNAARDIDAQLVVVGSRPERRDRRQSVAARLVRRGASEVLVVPLEATMAMLADTGHGPGMAEASTR